jgi:drug/metabolite transporter (DMT)-like permease
VTAAAGTSAAHDSRRLAWIAWTAVCLIWGTTYLAIKVALDTVPPFLMGGLRYCFGGLILAGVLRLRGHRLPPVSMWGTLAVLGIFMLLFGNGGVVWGEQYIPSGLTAVLIATSPFWMVSVDAMVTRGRQLHIRQGTGLVVGFAGIVLLVWPDIVAAGARGGSGWGFFAGVVAVQIACAGWAVGSSYTRRHVMPGDVLGSAAMQMIFGGIWMLLAGTFLGEWPALSFTARTSMALAYLTLAGSVVAFAAYSYALQHLDVAIVSLYTYVNPIIAVALGTLILGEPFQIRMLIAGAVIIGGILIVGPPRASAESLKASVLPAGD